MKTRSIIVGVLIISLLLSFGIGFMVGTQSERRINIEQQEQMCINSLLSAENWFESWKKTQNESDYWRGVSNFSSFLNSYEILVADDAYALTLYVGVYYDFASTLYTHDVECQSKIEKILTAIASLSENLSDENNYRKFRAIILEIQDEIKENT